MPAAGMVNHSATASLDLSMRKSVEDASEFRPTAPLSKLTGAGEGSTLLAHHYLSPKSGAHAGAAMKLPRDGLKGGGQIRMSNRSLLESVKDEMEFLAATEKPPEGLKKSETRRPDGDTGGANRGAAATEEHASPRAKATTKKVGGKVTQEERKRAEIFSKWQKTEDHRERDRKDIMERVEKGQERRQDRFNRMLEAVTGRDNLAYKTALALREREAHEDRRKRDLHAAWTDTVHKPLVDQADNHMNPPDRLHKQRMNGSKSVEFSLPGVVKSLVANAHDDPVRKPVVDHARENAFHQVATSLLRGSHSAPDLLRSQQMGPHDAIGAAKPGPGGGVVPRATTRPVFEPTNWGQRDIQGTMFGHFAQVAEHGPGFKRALRGGTNAHLSDGSDMVLIAGSRKSRTEGHGDVGILRGDTAAQGESANYKHYHGASCAAPSQDHFTYQTGRRVTDLEFPLGKKIFLEYH